MRNRIISVAVVMTMGLFAVATTGSDDKDEETPQAANAKPTPKKAAAPSKPEPPPVPDPEFVAERKAACDEYKAAGNEIKKSAVFAKYYEKKGGRGELNDEVGKVEEISTTTGGSEVMLTLTTRFGSLGNNAFLAKHVNSKRYLIKKGSPIYSQIGELSEGQEVTFSATEIAPDKNPFGEEISVCGDTWLARFTKVEPKK